MRIERRIEELERKEGVGIPKCVVLYARCEKRGDEERAKTEARARYEAEHGPINPDARVAIMLFGPAGHWIETPDGPRWQYPDGTLTDDPTGTRRAHR